MKKRGFARNKNKNEINIIVGDNVINNIKIIKTFLDEKGV